MVVFEYNVDQLPTSLKSTGRAMENERSLFHNPKPYRCIHCLQPCPSLYKTYGGTAAATTTTTTIKLSPCTACGENVDPYCEREWLLVTLDLILCRSAAYRHVLCNRFRLMGNKDHRKKLDRDNPSLDVSLHDYYNNNNYYYYGMLASAVLRAHIGMVSTQVRIDADHTPVEAVWHFVTLTAVSWLGYSLQILVTAVILPWSLRVVVMVQRHQRRRRRLLLDQKTATTTTIRTDDHDHTSTAALKLSQAKVAMALLLPTVAVYSVTALIHLWENSDTVRQLGSFLLLGHQWLALTTVGEAMMMTLSLPTTAAAAARTTAITMTTSTTVLLTMVTILAFLVGLLVRAVVMEASWRFFVSFFATDSVAVETTALPCPGLQCKVMKGITACFA